MAKEKTYSVDRILTPIFNHPDFVFNRNVHSHLLYTMIGIHSVHVPSRTKFSITPIPFDVECAILDQVSYNFMALRACTLVCREWATIAQQRLFRSVCIDLERSTGHNGQDCDPQELQRFLDFLDGNSHIAGFVRTVTVHGGSMKSLAGFIRATLSKTPRIRTLVLSFLTLDPEIVSQTPPLDAFVQDDEPFPRTAIDTLEISWCEFNGARSLPDVLGLFSRIRQIRVWSCDAKSDLGGPDAAVPRPSSMPMPAIESVVLDTMHCDSPSLLRSALSASSFANGALNAIRLKLTRRTDLEDFLLPCLRGAAAHLRKLHLDLDRRLLLVRPGIVLAPWNALVASVESCTALESLTFAIEGKHQPRTPYTDYLRAVLPAYARLVSPPPPSVRTVTFKVLQGDEPQGHVDEDGDEPRNEDEDEEADAGVRQVLEAIEGGAHWARMDAELAAHRGLARCAFVFYNGEGRPAGEMKGRVVDALQRLLPRLLKKGVLGVEMRPPMERQELLYEI